MRIRVKRALGDVRAGTQEARGRRTASREESVSKNRICKRWNEAIIETASRGAGQPGTSLFRALLEPC
jgi:hypothetical protein